MHPAKTSPYDEKRKQAQEVFARLAALHARLDALDAAIAVKTRKMSEYGSLDPDIRRFAADTASLEANPPASIIVTEINALGRRLTR